MIRSVSTVSALAGALLAACAVAQAGEHVDVLVFTQPGAGGDGLSWSATQPLLPCHAVALRDGGGAEAAFGGEEPCAKKAGMDPAYSGYAAAGPSTLAAPAAKLKGSGYGVLVNRGWHQGSGGLSPVLLRGGPAVGAQPEFQGTVEVGGTDKLPEVTIDFVLARPGKDGKTPEYVTVHETRRMKPGEPHYFDHPLLGAIVQVTADTPSP